MGGSLPAHMGRRTRVLQSELLVRRVVLGMFVAEHWSGGAAEYCRTIVHLGQVESLLKEFSADAADIRERHDDAPAVLERMRLGGKKASEFPPCLSQRC